MNRKDWLDKKVITTKDMEKIPKGSTGIVTADLPDEDVFAVWFDEPFELQPPWIRFDYASKDKFFKIVEM